MSTVQIPVRKHTSNGVHANMEVVNCIMLRYIGLAVLLDI